MLLCGFTTHNHLHAHMQTYASQMNYLLHIFLSSHIPLLSYFQLCKFDFIASNFLLQMFFFLHVCTNQIMTLSVQVCNSMKSIFFLVYTLRGFLADERVHQRLFGLQSEILT